MPVHCCGRPVSVFAFGGSERERLEVAVVGYEREFSGHYDDDNWLSVTLRVQVAGFSGTADATMTTVELLALQEMLHSLQKDPWAQAEFSAVEEQLRIALTGSGRGAFLLRGEIADPSGNTLRFSLEMDLSQLGATSRQLGAVLRAFPIRETTRSHPQAARKATRSAAEKMSETQTNARRLVEAILNTSSTAEQFADAFFDCCPATRENREAFRRIALRGSAAPRVKGQRFGVCLKNRDIYLSDVLYALEQLDEAPEIVKAGMPRKVLSKADWAALMRAAVLLAIGLETHILRSEDFDGGPFG